MADYARQCGRCEIRVVMRPSNDVRLRREAQSGAKEKKKAVKTEKAEQTKGAINRRRRRIAAAAINRSLNVDRDLFFGLMHAHIK